MTGIKWDRCVNFVWNLYYRWP